MMIHRYGMNFLTSSVTAVNFATLRGVTSRQKAFFVPLSMVIHFHVLQLNWSVCSSMFTLFVSYTRIQFVSLSETI